MPLSSNHDPTTNAYGVLHTTAHTGKNTKNLPSLRGRKSHYQIARSGVIDREERFRVYGITGTHGRVVIISKSTWQSVLVSEPGGVCEPFEFEIQGPLECEVLGMHNAIVMAEVLE